MHKQQHKYTTWTSQQVITVPETRFILILRDPVDRAISQLFTWKKEGHLKDLLHQPITASYIHKKMAKQIDRLSRCFIEYGPKACIYFTTGEENNISECRQIISFSVCIFILALPCLSNRNHNDMSILTLQQNSQ